MNLWSNNTLVPSQPFSEICFHDKQFLEIKLFTFDYHEKSNLRCLGANVYLDQRFILRRSCPLISKLY